MTPAYQLPMSAEAYRARHESSVRRAQESFERSPDLRILRHYEETPSPRAFATVALMFMALSFAAGLILVLWIG